MRRIRTQFPQPVFDGDSVTGGRVVSLAQEGDPTLTECEVWLDRGDGTRNLAARAWAALTRDPR